MEGILSRFMCFALLLFLATLPGQFKSVQGRPRVSNGVRGRWHRGYQRPGQARRVSPQQIQGSLSRVGGHGVTFQRMRGPRQQAGLATWPGWHASQSMSPPDRQASLSTWTEAQTSTALLAHPPSGATAAAAGLKGGPLRRHNSSLPTTVGVLSAATPRKDTAELAPPRPRRPLRVSRDAEKTITPTPVTGGDNNANVTAHAASGDNKANITAHAASGDNKANVIAHAASGDKKANVTAHAASGDNKTNVTSHAASGDMKANVTAHAASGDNKANVAAHAASGDMKANVTAHADSGNKKADLATAADHDEGQADFAARLASVNHKSNFTIVMMHPPSYLPELCGGCRWGLTGNITYCAVKGDPDHPPPQDADISALWYYMPFTKASPFHLRPDVPVVAFSPESEVRFKSLANDTLLREFDIEHSYRISSTVVPEHIHFLYGKMVNPADARASKGFFAPPRPTPDKVNGIGCVISNCWDVKNERNRLVQRLMATFKVDSYGKCWNNMGPIPGWNEQDAPLENIMKKYRFCVAFENSNVRDYVSEKVYHCLTAGSLPLYLGAPNVQEFLPYDAARMILDRGDFATDDLFLEEIKRLSQNDTAYEEYMAWKEDARAGKPFHPAFKKFLDAKPWLSQSELCDLATALATRSDGNPSKSR